MFEDFAQAMAATAFVVAILSIAKLAKAGHQEVAIGQSIGADVVGDAGRHDLLGAAAADTEEEFDGGAIDERAREGFESLEDVGDFGVPDWFCRHGLITMLVRRCAKCNQANGFSQRPNRMAVHDSDPLKTLLRSAGFCGVQDQSIPKRDLITGFFLHRLTDVTSGKSNKAVATSRTWVRGNFNLRSPATKNS